MKHFLLIFGVLLSATLLAQSPQAINYQGVARDANGDALMNQSIGVQFQLHQSTAVGMVVYSETHNPTTNELGLFTVEVGNGTIGTGTFATIDWKNGPYFLEVGVDPTGGSSYTSLGTQQLLSVPYALHAGDDGDWAQNADTLHTSKLVGIGTTVPDTTLHVEGGFKYVDGNQGEAKILASDGQGNASWQKLGTETFFGSGNSPQVDLSCLSTAGSLGLGILPRSVAVSGNYAYVVDGISDDLKVIDISDPALPSLAGSLGIGTDPRSVAVSGNYAYVVDGHSDDLKVIDISDPALPSLAGSLGIGSFPFSIAISGNYAYVVDVGSDDLKVIDISNPAAPFLAGSLSIGTLPRSVAVSGNYAYVVDEGSDDLKVIDISDPALPSLAGSLGIGTDPSSVAVSGNYAYVVDLSSDDLKVIDISDPTVPTLVSSLGVGSLPVSVAVSGNYVYVVDLGSDDLKVIDISDPASPSLAGSLGIGSGPLSLAVSGNYAYVVDATANDLKVIELFCQQMLTIDPATGDFTTELLVTNSGTENYLGKFSATGDALIDGSIFDNGNVGIGTMDPAVPLEVVSSNGGVESGVSLMTYNAQTTNSGGSGISFATDNDSNEKTSYGRIYGVRHSGVSGDEDGGLLFGHLQDGAMVYPMSLRNGRLGIGTSSPASELHVVGEIRTDGAYSIRSPDGNSAGEIRTTQDSGVNNGIVIASERSNGKIVFMTNHGGIAERMRVNDNGNVGIGFINPTVRLDVNGSIEYTGTITDVSDRRMKEDFQPINDALGSLQQVETYTYLMKDDTTGIREYGVIAQELQQIFPEMVTEVDAEKGYLGVSYIQLIPVLIEAIKEQQESIEELALALGNKEEENTFLKAQLQQQQEAISANTKLLLELQSVLQAQTKR